MLSVVEGTLVSEGEGDEGDICADEESVKEESVDDDLVSGDSVDEKEAWLDRASVDEDGGLSGVGVDGEGWVIAEVIFVDTVEVSVEKTAHDSSNLAALYLSVKNLICKFRLQINLKFLKGR